MSEGPRPAANMPDTPIWHCPACGQLHAGNSILCPFLLCPLWGWPWSSWTRGGRFQIRLPFSSLLLLGTLAVAATGAGLPQPVAESGPVVREGAATSIQPPGGLYGSAGSTNPSPATPTVSNDHSPEEPTCGCCSATRSDSSSIGLRDKPPVRPAQAGCDSLLCGVDSPPRPRKRRTSEGPELELPAGLFGENQVTGLLADFFVPRLVEALIQECLKDPQEA